MTANRPGSKRAPATQGRPAATVRRLRRSALVYGMITATLLTAMPAGAEDDLDYKEARELVRQGKILPLNTIVQRAREHRPGKVLGVELERRRDVLIYELQVLTEDGVVWELKYDAATGKLVKQEKED